MKKIAILFSIILCSFSIKAQAQAQAQPPYCVTDTSFILAIPLPPQCFDTMKQAETYLHTDASPDNGARLLQREEKVIFSGDKVIIKYSLKPKKAVLNSFSSYVATGGRDCNGNLLPIAGNFKGCTSEANLSANIRNSLGTGWSVSFSGAYRTVPIAWYPTVFDTVSNRYYVLVDMNGARKFAATKLGSTTVNGSVVRFDFYQCPMGYRGKEIFGTTENPAAVWPYICGGSGYRTITVPTAQYCSDTKDGNPCVAATGNKEYRENDFEWDGELFTRAYNSVRDLPLFSGLGDNWAHSYSERLSINATDSTLIWIRSDGYYERFVTADGVKYTSRNNAGIVITKEADAVAAVKGRWRIESKTAKIKWFDDAGKLKRIESGGKLLTFGYCTSANFDAALCPQTGILLQVLNSNGRKLDFDYQTINVPVNGLGESVPEIRIASVKLNGTAVMGFAYNATTAQLTSVVYGSIGQLQGRQYLYAEPAFICKDRNGGAIAACDPTLFPDHLTGVIDENNVRFATYTYDEKGRVTSSKHANDAEITRLNYITATATEVTTATGAKKTYGISNDLSGFRKPTSVITQDANGLQTSSVSSTYTNLRLTSRVDSIGSRTNFAYNALNETGRTEGLAADGTLTPQTRTLQTDWHTGFNVPIENRLLNTSNALEARSTYAYNARRQVTAACEIDPGNAAAMSYACGSLADAPPGVRQSTATYCEAANITAGQCPLEGLVTSTNGPRTDVSDVVTFTYRQLDASTCASAPASCAYRKGDLWKVTQVVNGVSHVNENIAYDTAGRVLQSKDANNVIADMEYNTRGWLMARKVRGTDDTIESDDVITRIDYDLVGQVTKITNPDLGFTSFHYDDAHRLDKITDAAGNSITYTLDEAGNRKAETTKDYANMVTRSLSRVYDSLGRLQQSKNAATAVVATLTYDGNGNLNTSTNALGRVLDQDVDPLDRLKKSIQDVGAYSATTQYEYDARDNLTKVIDPKLLNTVYSYNGLNDRTGLSSPDTGSASYTYDNAGNRKTQTDAKGVVVNYTYDEMNRLKKVIYPTATLGSEFFYDTANSICTATEVFSKGRLTKFTDPSGSTEYCYDRFGNMTRKQVNNNGAISSFAFTYLRSGRLSTLTYPSGMKVNYVRNNIGQISQVSITQGTTTKIFANNISYYPFGPLSHIEWLPPGSGGTTLRAPLSAAASGGGGCLPTTGGCTPVNPVIQSRFYDQDYAVQNVGGLYYTVDNQGNIKSVNDAYGSNAFDYDTLDRLYLEKDGNTQALVSGYNYDELGNRLAKTKGSNIIEHYRYDNGTNHLNRTVAGGFERVYDPNGNSMQTDSNKYFTYDERNRMVDFRNTASTIVSQYQYNAKGERVRKYLGAADQATYVFDESGQLLVETKAALGTTHEIIWLDNMPIGINQNGLYGILTDHLNTPREVFSIAKQQTYWRWNVADNAFGETLAINTGMEFDLRFPGQIFDVESGLHYNFFRDYEPGTGRYVQSDPIGLAGGISTYGYVGGNPLGRIDPTGLACSSGGGVTYCAYPGGPLFGVPTQPGFKDFDGSEVRYHQYDIQRNIGCANANGVMHDFINHPTPSSNARPATPQGTRRNDASVFRIPNLVTTFLTTDLRNGNPLVVNMTAPGSAFDPGYVARTVTNGVAHTYGEGTSLVQFDREPHAWLLNKAANELIWGGQMQDFIDNNPSSCECQ
jgi:RHS repeat-associated protein